MSREQLLDNGPGKLKFVILGAIVVVFGGGIAIATHGGQAPAKAKTEQAASATAPAAAPAQDTADASAAAQAPATDSSASAVAAAPADAAMPSETASAAPTQAAAAPVATAPAAAAPAPVSAPAPAAAPSASYDVADAAGASTDSEPAAAPATASAVNKPRPAVRTPPPPALDALRPWWRQEVSAQDFNVQYVGQAASEDALVFRFSKSLPNIDAAAQQIRITDARGNAVSGKWAEGQNQYVAVYRGLTPGRYMVHIDGGLKSASGNALGESLQGPVYVE